jgi:iron complex outermembrane receptor protein
MDMQKVIRKGVVFLTLLSLFTVGPQLFAAQQDQNKPADLFEMPLEELKEIEIASTATLTEVQPRLVPAAVTTITEEQIQACGARSLLEVLEIYVPNLQWWGGYWEADNIGLRGIIGDHDDKYLLLVNGRVMNERTHFGVVSERDLVMMRDIHHIDVVRGPGSAMYGPGAVIMVINIITHNAKTFEGTEVTGRTGAIEEFYSGELKHGRKFKDGDGGIFAYAGIGKYPGANPHDSPRIFGFDFPAAPAGTTPDPWDGHQRGKPLTSASGNDGEDFRHRMPMKLYTEITKGNWDIWLRYTRGGKQMVLPTRMLARGPYGWGEWMGPPYGDSGYGYQQATGFIGYKKDLDEKTVLDLSFSYDMFDFEVKNNLWVVPAFREDKYFSKATIRHDINPQHKIAVGVEVLYGEYGYRSPGWPDWSSGDEGEGGGIDNEFANVGGMPRWSTRMISVVGEHQWTINDQWTAFLGARIDDHTYTKKLFSPRAALVFTPNKKDTYKLMWARSVRANSEERMKDTAMMSGGTSDPEKLDSLELRYERKHNENLDFAASGFLHYKFELIGYVQAAQAQVVLGEQKDWGFELEALYHTDRTRLGISHGFTKLIEFELTDPTQQTVQNSAHQYGYGHDLARWANHITKVQGQYKLDEKWTLDGSLRIYWGLPGLKDDAKYRAVVFGYNTLNGWERSFRGSYFLNLGLQYQPKKNLTFRIDGYNLLGIFSKDFNKRNYGGNENSLDYRCAAPALGFSMTYKF